MNQLPLTKRQHDVLTFLREFIAQKGYAPSLEETGKHFGLASLATVHKHLENLKAKGYITRAWGRSRHLDVLKDGPVCTRCGRPLAEAKVEAVSPMESEGESVRQ